MSVAVQASLLDTLCDRIAQEGDPRRRAEVMVLALADALKATSNDQNVQRLSRELRLVAGELAGSLTSA